MEWTLRDAGIPGGRVEVAALTGGSILAGADVFAEAMRNDVARTYVMVGGAGHTTETFRARPAAAAGIAPPELAHAQGAAPINAGPPHTFRNERLRDFAKQSDLEWRNVRGGPTGQSTKAPYASNPSVAAAMPAASSPK